MTAQFVDDCEYERPHESDHWIFGFNAAIEFTANGAVSTPTQALYDNINGIASISDKGGNLRLFSDGYTIYGPSYVPIKNGTGLAGNQFSSQPVLIVPHPGDISKYFVFTVDLYFPQFGFDKGINYSEVTFANVNSNASVGDKNVNLIKSNAQKICAVEHSNGSDYWVLMHGLGATGTQFYAFLIDTAGIAPNPVITDIGFNHIGDDEPFGAGSMKFSPDGTKIGLAITDDGVVEILDFDKSTGKVSNPVTSGVNQFVYPNDVEFSPDNSKMYLTTNPLDRQLNYLYQFDLTASDPFANPTIIHTYDPVEDSLVGGLQLGVDGKIYVSFFQEGGQGYPDLGVIFNPNRPAKECNYNSLDRAAYPGFSLGGAKSSVGMPNFVSTFLDVPHFTYLNHCHKDTTVFSITNTNNIDDTDWDFGDKDGDLVSDDNFIQSFEFSEPGTYTVELTESFDNDYTYTENVTIYPLPFVDLGQGADTIYILPNTAVQLDAGDYDFYYWQPDGSRERYLTVTEEGLYSVMVQDSNCCRNGDDVYIDYTELYYPSAFRPGSSITQNSVFKVVGNTQSLGGYLLQVFDRWGGMIFESTNPAEGWDGTFNGDPVPVGTYVWKSVFQSFDVEDQPGAEFADSGTVTLVR